MSSSAPPSSSSSSNPVVLPFVIDSYDGGFQKNTGDIYIIDNILTNDRSQKHCSSKGKNFNLVLRYSPGPVGENTNTEGGDAVAAPGSTSYHCRISHIAIRGAYGCTSPILTGVVFVSKNKPNIEEYTADYNDMKKEAYNSLDAAKKSKDGALVFFHLSMVSPNDPDSLEIPITLSALTEPIQYVHVKFISGYETDEDEHNIDIERLAIVGFDETDGPSDVKNYQPIPKQLTDLNLIKNIPTGWNRLKFSFISAFQNKPSLIFLGLHPMEKPTLQVANLLYELAHDEKNYPFMKDIPVYHSFDADEQSRTSEFAKTTRRMFFPAVKGAEGNDKEEEEEEEENEESGEKSAPKVKKEVKLFITKGDGSFKRYPFVGDATSLSDITSFIQNFVNGKLPRISAPRPKDDKDPAEPGITIVTADTFEELVTSSPNNVLLYTYDDDSTKQIGRVTTVITALGPIFADHPSLRIMKLDSDANDVIVPSVPLVQLYKKGSTAPVTVTTCTDSVLPSELINNLKEEFQLDIDTTSLNKKIKKADTYVELRRKLVAEMENFSKKSSGYQTAFSRETPVAVFWMQSARNLLHLAQEDEGVDEEEFAATLATYKAVNDHMDAALPHATETTKLLKKIQMFNLGDKEDIAAEEKKSVQDLTQKIKKILGIPGEDDEENEEEEDEDGNPVPTDTSAGKIEIIEDGDEEEEKEEEKAEIDGADENDAKKEAEGGEEDEDDEAAITTKLPKLPAFITSLPSLEGALNELKKVWNPVYEKLQSKQGAGPVAGVVAHVYSQLDLDSMIAASKKKSTLLVIDFTASWCPPCKRIAPILADMAKEFTSVIFAKVDVDECDEISAAYKVEAMPTFVFIDAGVEEEERIQGADAPGIKTRIKKYVAAHSA